MLLLDTERRTELDVILSTDDAIHAHHISPRLPEFGVECHHITPTPGVRPPASGGGLGHDLTSSQRHW